jgi:DNA invertase Pin-like site-specific DNA recombinase
LICDLDGLYDPATYNDRLLLGLKGMMSEAELHIIRQRMLQGAQQKARRGELVTRVPMGYLRDDHGRVPGTPYLTAWLRFVASSRPVMRYVKEVF